MEEIDITEINVDEAIAQLVKDISFGKSKNSLKNDYSDKFIKIFKKRRQGHGEEDLEKTKKCFNGIKFSLIKANKVKEFLSKKLSFSYNKASKPYSKPQYTSLSMRRIKTREDAFSLFNAKGGILAELILDVENYENNLKLEILEMSRKNNIVIRDNISKIERGFDINKYSNARVDKKSMNPVAISPSRITIDFQEFKVIMSELKELYKIKSNELNSELQTRLTELETKMHEKGVLTSRSPIVKRGRISALSISKPRTIFLPNFSNEAQLREFLFEILEPGWYTGESEPVDKNNLKQLREVLKKAQNKEINGKWFNQKGEVIDINNPQSLKEAGLKEITKKGWYNKNLKWFPDELTDDKVVYVFKRDAGKNPIDTGHGPKHELKTSYIYTKLPESGINKSTKPDHLAYIKEEDMTPGEEVEAQKCSSGHICVLPVGEKIFTSEGIVTVQWGEISIIREGDNSISLMSVSDLNQMYKPDPMNPASKELFELSKIFDKLLPLTEEQKKINKENGVIYDKSPLTEKEKLLAKKHCINYERGPITIAQAVELQSKIAIIFEKINKGQKLVEILCSKEEKPNNLLEEYKAAAVISKKIDEKFLSRIDCSNFDKGLKEARKVMNEIIEDPILNETQKEAAIMGVMTHMITTTNLHQHVKGSTPKDVTMRLAKNKGLPEMALQDIESAYTMAEKGYPTLSKFNKAYDIIGQVIFTQEDYKSSIEGIICESMKRGQQICEIRCACDSLYYDKKRKKQLSPREGTLAILKAIEEVKAEISEKGLEPPKTGFVFLIFRGKEWDGSIPMAIIQAKEAVRIAKERPEIKFGLDVAGPEDTGWGPTAFKEAIEIINKYNRDIEEARKQGKETGNTIGITMHAGETTSYEGGDGYKSVLEAIEMGAKRIGHGVALARHLKYLETSDPIEFERILKQVKDSGVIIEICGVCNIQSIPINSADLNQHPVQTFLEYGIPVTICTDNDAICNTNISKEYIQFLLTGHSNLMNWNSIKKIVRDSVEASFIPEYQKAEVRVELERRIRLVQHCYDEVIFCSKK